MKPVQNIFEFIYKDPETDDEYLVEVLTTITPSYPNADSDWDAKQHIQIDKVEFWTWGEGTGDRNEPSTSPSSIQIDISEDVIYSEISAQIRAAGIARSFDEEDGGF